jgi:CheY-like chemotaxis protein
VLGGLVSTTISATFGVTTLALAGYASWVDYRIDGYAVARRIRDDPAGYGLRLVALTGYGFPEDRERALAAGFDAHVAKPVDLDKLQAILAET